MLVVESRTLHTPTTPSSFATDLRGEDGTRRPSCATSIRIFSAGSLPGCVSRRTDRRLFALPANPCTTGTFLERSLFASASSRTPQLRLQSLHTFPCHVAPPSASGIYIARRCYRNRFGSIIAPGAFLDPFSHWGEYGAAVALSILGSAAFAPLLIRRSH